MDKKELKVEMLRHGDNGETLAEALSITNVTLSKKMNGVSDFTRKEMLQIKERYSLSDERLFAIFFAENMS